jgi:hypothetical protein
MNVLEEVRKRFSSSAILRIRKALRALAFAVVMAYASLSWLLLEKSILKLRPSAWLGTRRSKLQSTADGARGGVRHRLPDLLPEYLRSRGQGAALKVAAGRFAFEGWE